MSSGDSVAAENYLQHAEHYNRIILAAQAQNPGIAGADGQNGMNGGRFNQQEPFQRDYDGDSDEAEGDDYAPQQQRVFPERTDQRGFHDRHDRPSYNQHQQPQPFIPQNAFQHAQPQPVIPAANGASSHPGEGYGPAQDGDRMPRRRRRRPMGDPKGYLGHNGPPGTPAVNGSAGETPDPSSDEPIS